MNKIGWVLVDPDGKVVDGTNFPSREYCVWSEFYKETLDLNNLESIDYAHNKGYFFVPVIALTPEEIEWFRFVAENWIANAPPESLREKVSKL